MNNKISKRRLSNFLAYEWILMIVVALAAIVVWELIFSFSSVRLKSSFFVSSSKVHQRSNFSLIDILSSSFSGTNS